MPPADASARRGRRIDDELPPATQSLWPAFVLLAVIVVAAAMVLWGAR